MRIIALHTRLNHSAHMEEIKKQIREAIQKNGHEGLQKAIVPNLLKMVAGTQLKKLLGVSIVAVGYSDYNPEGLKAAVECLLEVMPQDDDETKRLNEAYEYFKANEADILADHHITAEA